MKILMKLLFLQPLFFEAAYSAQITRSISTIGLPEYTKLGTTDENLAKIKKAISDPNYQALQTERAEELDKLKEKQTWVVQNLLIAKEYENFYTTVFKDRGSRAVFDEFIEASKSEKRPDRIVQAINAINRGDVKYGGLLRSLSLSKDLSCTYFINFLIGKDPTLRKALSHCEINSYATLWHLAPYSPTQPSDWLRGLVTKAEKLVRDDFNAYTYECRSGCWMDCSAYTNEDREQLDGPVELYSIAHDIIHQNIWRYMYFSKGHAVQVKRRFENRQHEFKCFLESRNLVPLEEEAQYLNSENGLIAANYQGQNPLTDEEVELFLKGKIPDYSSDRPTKNLNQ